MEKDLPYLLGARSTLEQIQDTEAAHKYYLLTVMFGDFRFSYVGLIYLLMLFIPNFIWTKNLPQGYENIVEKKNKVLLIFERIVFTDFNIHSFSLWSTWLILSFIIMILYEINWIQYFKSNIEPCTLTPLLHL